jgi:TP901 family phage tail tape measure protein
VTDTSLIFTILGKDKASATAGKVRGAFDAMATGIAAGVVAAGAGLVKVGQDLDAAYDTIRTGTGATGDALAGLQQDFKNALVDVPADTATVSQALADLNTRTGATGKDLESLTETMVRLGQVSGEDTSALIESTTRVFGDWGIATGDQAATLDKLWRTSQSTGIGVDALADKVVQFGAPLRQMGFGFDESIALLGQFEQQGVNSELVMGSMRVALGRLAKDGKEPVAAFREQVEAIKAAGDTGTANALALELFGARAGPDMAAAIREGRFEVDELVATVSGGSETIAAASSDTADFSEKLQMLKNRGYVALEPYALKAVEYLTATADALGRAADWAQRNQGTVQALAITLGVLAGAVLAVKVGMVAYAATMAVVRGATATWTAVQWLLNTAFFASPITWIVLGIVALVAIIVLIATKTTWFQQLWSWAWGGIKAAAVAVWDWIKGNWPLLLTILTGPIGLAVSAIVRHWDKIKSGANTVWQWVKTNWPLLLAIITGPIGLAVLAITRNWDKIKSGAAAVVDWFRGMPGRIGSALAGIADRISSPFRDAFNSIARWWNRGPGAISFTVPSWVPGVGGRGFNVPNIPTLAEGGIVQATPGGVLAILGEGGQDEAVVPLPRGNRRADAAAGGGTPTVRLEVSDSEVGRLLLAVLRRSVRTRGGRVEIVLGARA